MDNYDTFRERQKQKQKTQSRLGERDKKSSKNGENKSQIFSGNLVLKKKTNKDKTKSKKKDKRQIKNNDKNNRSLGIMLEGFIKRKLDKKDKNDNNYLLLKLTSEEVIFVFASKIKEEK
jgi:hypothetical protein